VRANVWPRLRNTMAWFGVAMLLMLLLCILLLRYSKDLLAVNAPLPNADWIVLLGGQAGERVMWAAELYHQGLAPRIFVAGGAECRLMVSRLEMTGVPSAKIDYECRSQSTYDNALYTRQKLEAFNPHKIILVTSWYHTVRAVDTFSKVWPGIEWGTYGVSPVKSSFASMPIYEISVVLIEYVKSLWYRIYY
jgi:uncharacterized SAM-binding protein YcdF (DUF218 family)